MKDKIKFPFEPNEKVKAAFEQSSQYAKVLDMMIKALTQAFTQEYIDPWSIVQKEHPELMDFDRLSYNHLTKKIILRINKGQA
jgi:hypothetical protein